MWENHLNSGGEGCSEQRLHHRITARVTEEDCIKRGGEGGGGGGGGRRRVVKEVRKISN